MPRIPTYDIQSRATAVNFPNRFPVEDIAGGGQALANNLGGLASGISKVGERYAEIENRLRRRQEEFELTETTAGYNADVARIMIDLPRDPEVAADPLQAQGRFATLEREARTNWLARSKSPTVKQAFTNYVSGAVPMKLLEARERGVKLLAEQQFANLNRVEEDLSYVAATTGDPEERDRAISTYEELAGRMRESGLMTEKDYGTRVRGFRGKALEKNMEFLQGTAPALLRELDREGAFRDLDPIKRLKVLEAAREDERKAEADTKRAFKDTQDTHEATWAAKANQGLLSAAEIDEALAGRHQFITPDKARAYQTINYNPPDAAADLAVQTLRQDYRSGSITQGRINTYKGRALSLQRNQTRPNKEMSAFLNELQSDELAARGVEAQEFNRALAGAKDDLKATAKPPTGLPFIDRMIRNLSLLEQDEVTREMRRARERGENPEAARQRAVERIQKRREEKSKALTPEQRDRQRLYKGDR